MPGEEGEDTEDAEGAATDAPETAANGAATAKPKSKRKPRGKKAVASEARIDGGETTEADVKKEDKPAREKKERKPREKKLAPSGEESKVCSVCKLPASRSPVSTLDVIESGKTEPE